MNYTIYSVQNIIDDMFYIIEHDNSLDGQINRIKSLFENKLSEQEVIVVKEYIKLQAVDNGFDNLTLSDFASKLIAIVSLMISMLIFCFNGVYHIDNTLDWLKLFFFTLIELVLIIAFSYYIDSVIQNRHNKLKAKYKLLYSIVNSITMKSYKNSFG